MAAYKLAPLALLAAGAMAPASLNAQVDPAHFNNRNGIRHVLLISIDGMHAVDFLNCSKGIPGINFGQPYCPALAQLAQHGVNYLDTTTSKPSDSYPWTDGDCQRRISANSRRLLRCRVRPIAGWPGDHYWQ